MRKQIGVSEALLSRNMMNRKIMNDIMYYLRKLIKLARRAQTLSIREGTDISEEESKILEELEYIENDIKDLEKELDYME